MNIKQLKQLIKEEINTIINEDVTENMKKMAEIAIKNYISLLVNVRNLKNPKQILDFIKMAFNIRMRMGLTDIAIEALIQDELKNENTDVKECSKVELDEDLEADKEKMVKGIKKGIQSGQIPKTYKDKTGKTQKTNPFAIANAHYGSKK